MAVSTMTALSLAALAASTAVTAYGIDTQAKQEEANLKFTAEQGEADARAEAGAAQVEAMRIRKAAKAQRAQAVAAAAASGIDVNSPTSLRIDADIVAAHEEDASLVILQGSDRAKRLNQQAQADRYGASAARSAGRINQAATLLSAASTATVRVDNWKRAKQGGG